VAATFPTVTHDKLNASKRQATPGGPGRSVRAPWGDALFAFLATASAWLTLSLLVGIILSLIVGALPAIREYGLSFLWTSEWNPPEDRYGGLVMIYGTLMTSIIALVIAVPVSFGIALFLTELSPGWLKRPLGIAIELLAAVPSIVYGMWGLMVFGPILADYVQVACRSWARCFRVPRWALVCWPPASSWPS
jgi:phosphate transport system permease protein